MTLPHTGPKSFPSFCKCASLVHLEIIVAVFHKGIPKYHIMKALCMF